jgi:hypothetical protein
MSNYPSHLADNNAPPVRGEVLAVAVAAAGSADVDLQDSANRPASSDRLYWQNRYVSIQADGGDLYVQFATSGAGLAPDPTVTGIAATTCVKIPADGVADFLIPAGTPGLPSGATDPRGHWLRFYSVAGATARIWASSPRGGL